MAEALTATNILALPNGVFQTKPAYFHADRLLEILTLILNLLDRTSIGRCAQLSRRFNRIAMSDLIWAKLVSSLRLSSPAPYKSFRELYAALHHHLWLHGQVWHGDRRFTGYLLIARYNPKTGAIEIYNLLANDLVYVSSSNARKPWSIDSSVLISTLQPRVRFWEEPILTLTKDTPPNPQYEVQPPSRRSRGSIACSLSRTVVIPPERQDRSMSLWPPINIPSTERTRNTSIQGFRGVGHQPQSINDAAKKLFRLRKWMVFNEHPGMPFERTLRHLMMKDDVETFSALDKTLYTPDNAHPLRGLWVGDYSSHGWEFILFHQPRPERLEGIKITGDINVPRGEYTFIIENLNEVLRIAHEEEWPGSKVVKGKGQIAASQFVDSQSSASHICCMS